MTVEELIRPILNQGPFVVLFFLALLGFKRRWWRFGDDFTDQEARHEAAIREKDASLERERKRADRNEELWFRSLDVNEKQAAVMASVLAGRQP